MASEKLKSIINLIFVLVVISVTSIFLFRSGARQTSANENNSDSQIVKYYSCGMHPSVKVSTEEYKKGNVPNSINIPVGEIRGRVNEIPRDKTIAVFCHVGIRAHIACRILSQKGYKTRNISGGYLSFINHRDAYDTNAVMAVQIALSEGTFCTGPTGELLSDKKWD